MKTFHDEAIAWEPADPSHFTGQAWVKRVAAVDDDGGVKIYRVKFEPGARTHWHTHSGMQVLWVIVGRCRVRKWGEAVQEVSPGDAVYIAPGEKHWHGAAPDSIMAHVAINVNARTTWMEAVSDEHTPGL
ncbi:MAG: cupin domain-containing protein [Rhodothermales bacterium]